MSFLHLSLLAGLGAITVPVMLHLFGQSQPKLIDFPALRFVRETTQEQRMSWQLRHFLLLLLRILLFATLAIALARPRVHSAMLGSVLGVSAVGLVALLATLIAAVALASRRPARIWLVCGLVALSLWIVTALWGVRTVAVGPAVPQADQSAPVAAAIIIDNSPSMELRAGNQTRIEAAKEMGEWILEKLPPDSRVGLLTGVPLATLSLTPATAVSQVKILEARGSHVDLAARIRTALDLVLANELERKEIYVLTDLMSAQWSASQPGLSEMLGEHAEQVLLQIIDLGGGNTVNYRLGEPSPDFEIVAEGGEATIEVRVERSAESKPESLSVELYQEAIDARLPVIVGEELQLPPRRVVDRQIANLTESLTASVTLRAADLAAGTHNFEIRLDKPDPLMIDNTRYLSIEAQAQQPTLIVANDSDIGRNLQAIVDPSSLAETPGSKSLVDQVRYNQLSNAALERYKVICLYDPPPITDEAARRLDEHVRGGGGLMIILGASVEPIERLQGNPLTSLLPGEPEAVLSREGSPNVVFPEPLTSSHPIFFAFGDSIDQVVWNVLPIFRSWSFKSLTENTQVLMKLSDSSGPLLVLQRRGRGQIVTLTTPIPEVDSRERELWNLLWANDPVPAFAILLGAFRYLSGANQSGLNYESGQPVGLPNEPLTWPSRYELFLPTAQSRRVDALEGNLNLGIFETAGTFRLRGQRAEPVARAFSVNVPEQDTSLERMERVALDEHLGRNHYRLARSQDEVESSVGQARFGQELYPLVMLFVAGLFLAEQAMSNRFYKIQFGGTKGSSNVV